VSGLALVGGVSLAGASPYLARPALGPGAGNEEESSVLRIAVLHGATLDRPDEVDTLRTAEAVREALVALGHAAELVHLGPDLVALEALAVRRPDLVFNLVEAIGGDGALAAEVPPALDRCCLPYTGCGARATGRCLAKPDMKRAIAAAGLPTPAWSPTGDGMEGLPRVIVKAVAEHASLGLDSGSVVPGARAGAEVARRTGRLGVPHFAEEYVEGREFNLALLDGPAGPEVLPPAETLFVGYAPDRPRIVDYDAKWTEASHAYNNTPRRFAFGPEDRALLDELTALALRAWGLFGLSGYARVDFRVDAAGRPWILEVNTNPCLAPDAGFFAAAAEAGLSYPATVARIVDAALAQRTEAA
jgi:D-alanine-D-alanine ligase